MKPYWILRHHGSSSIRSLHHHRDHRLLGIGDDKGSVSLVDLKLLRARWRWDAHTDSILTVHIVSQHQILTHARDNTLKLWTLPDTPPSFGAATQTSSDATSTTPTLIRTIGVNALNFSKCAYFDGKVAVPNALDAAYIDILDLNSGMRTHEAIGRPDIKPAAGSRLPIVMSLHLLQDAVIAGYEDGRVKKWCHKDSDLIWEERCHSESVMSTAIHHANLGFGISVGADDRIARFDLTTGKSTLMQTKAPGKASVAIAPDGKTFAVGGWDGSIKVYSAENMQELGQLNYHRDTVECLAFAYAKLGDGESDDDEDEDEDDAEGDVTGVQLVLAAGGRDGKASLWKYH